MKLCSKCAPIDGVETQTLREPNVLNSLSRHDNQTYICNLCGAAEAMADYIGVSFKMARIQIENDYQEAKRLPKGGFHGSFYPVATGDEKDG